MRRQSHHIASVHACALALVWLLACALPSLAHAAFSTRILVVRGPGVSASMRESAREALVDLGEVVDDTNYLGAARDMGVDPASDEALMELAPHEYVKLVVVIARDDAGLHAMLRDGGSGQLLQQVDLPDARKRLSPDAQEQLRAAAEAVLGGAIPRAGGGDTAQYPQPSAADANADDYTEPSGASDAPAADDAAVADAPAAQDAADGALVAELAVGFGVGTRAVSTPSGAGPVELSTGVFPALDLGLRVSTPALGHWAFGAGMRYQTSVGLRASQQPAGGAVQESTLRSHHVELGVLPGYRFATGKRSAVLSLFAGWAVRGLRAVDELSLPPNTLHGPCVRPELSIPFGESVSLRLAPELIVLASLSKELRDLSSISGGGLAFGAEASLTVHSNDWLSFALSYRESHAGASTTWQNGYEDVERFVTLLGVLRY